MEVFLLLICPLLINVISISIRLMKFSLPFTLELVGVLSFSMGIPFPSTSKLLQPPQLLKVCFIRATQVMENSQVEMAT
jgi:hypothetical protein